MKNRSPILRIVTAFLILIFSQKTGAGLIYHNYFHSSSQNESPVEKDKGANYSCTCIDDFLTPFAGEEEVVLTAPLAEHILCDEFYKEQISSHTVLSSSLRGPPAYTKG